MSATDRIIAAFVLVALMLTAYGISCAAATDLDEWTRDEHGCYLHVATDRRVWWSPTGTTVTRGTYCPEADR